jgi:hypothetical protein
MVNKGFLLWEMTEEPSSQEEQQQDPQNTTSNVLVDAQNVLYGAVNEIHDKYIQLVENYFSGKVHSMYEKTQQNNNNAFESAVSNDAEYSVEFTEAEGKIREYNKNKTIFVAFRKCILLILSGNKDKIIVNGVNVYDNEIKNIGVLDNDFYTGIPFSFKIKQDSTTFFADGTNNQAAPVNGEGAEGEKETQKGGANEISSYYNYLEKKNFISFLTFVKSQLNKLTNTEDGDDAADKHNAITEILKKLSPLPNPPNTDTQRQSGNGNDNQTAETIINQLIEKYDPKPTPPPPLLGKVDFNASVPSIKNLIILLYYLKRNGVFSEDLKQLLEQIARIVSSHYDIESSIGSSNKVDELINLKSLIVAVFNKQGKTLKDIADEIHRCASIVIMLINSILNPKNEGNVANFTDEKNLAAIIGANPENEEVKQILNSVQNAATGSKPLIKNITKYAQALGVEGVEGVEDGSYDKSRKIIIERHLQAVPPAASAPASHSGGQRPSLDKVFSLDLPIYTIKILRVLLYRHTFIKEEASEPSMCFLAADVSLSFTVFAIFTAFGWTSIDNLHPLIMDVLVTLTLFMMASILYREKSISKASYTNAWTLNLAIPWYRFMAA